MEQKMSEKQNRDQSNVTPEILWTERVLNYKFGYKPTHRVTLKRSDQVYCWDSTDAQSAEFHSMILAAIANQLMVTISYTSDTHVPGVERRVQNIALSREG
jgi:hypothetical protein